MKYLITIISLLGIACEKKTSCESEFVGYVNTLMTEKEIADHAAEDMTKGCGGAYNIEEISKSAKNTIYRYSCPNKCH